MKLYNMAVLAKSILLLSLPVAFASRLPPARPENAPAIFNKTQGAIVIANPDNRANATIKHLNDTSNALTNAIKPVELQPNNLSNDENSPNKNDTWMYQQVNETIGTLKNETIPTELGSNQPSNLENTTTKIDTSPDERANDTINVLNNDTKPIELQPNQPINVTNALPGNNAAAVPGEVSADSASNNITTSRPAEAGSRSTSNSDPNITPGPAALGEISTNTATLTTTTSASSDNGLPGAAGAAGAAGIAAGAAGAVLGPGGVGGAVGGVGGGVGGASGAGGTEATNPEGSQNENNNDEEITNRGTTQSFTISTSDTTSQQLVTTTTMMTTTASDSTSQSITTTELSMSFTVSSTSSMTSSTTSACPLLDISDDDIYPADSWDLNGNDYPFPINNVIDKAAEPVTLSISDAGGLQAIATLPLSQLTRQASVTSLPDPKAQVVTSTKQLEFVSFNGLVHTITSGTIQTSEPPKIASFNGLVNTVTSRAFQTSVPVSSERLTCSYTHVQGAAAPGTDAYTVTNTQAFAGDGGLGLLNNLNLCPTISDFAFKDGTATFNFDGDSLCIVDAIGGAGGRVDDCTVDSGDNTIHVDKRALRRRRSNSRIYPRDYRVSPANLEPTSPNPDSLAKRGLVLSTLFQGTPKPSDIPQDVWIAGTIPGVDQCNDRIRAKATAGAPGVTSLFYTGWGPKPGFKYMNAWARHHSCLLGKVATWNTMVDKVWSIEVQKAIERPLAVLKLPEEERNAASDAFLKNLSQGFGELSAGDAYLFVEKGLESWDPKSAWGSYEYPALTRNPNIRNIYRVDLDLGEDPKQDISSVPDRFGPGNPRGEPLLIWSRERGDAPSEIVPHGVRERRNPAKSPLTEVFPIPVGSGLRIRRMRRRSSSGIGRGLTG